MSDFIAIALMLVGALILVVASIGLIRMPDLFTRMQAAAKASTLGVSCIMLGVAIHFGDLAISSRVVLVIAFLFVTGPVATHVIARAAYVIGIPLWQGSIRDDLRDSYDSETHELKSRADSEQAKGT